MTAAIGHHGAIKCAIDIALHDLAGKRLGLPVRELIGLPGDSRRPTSRSGSTTRRWSPSGAARAAAFPALKIKVGGPVGPRDARGGPGGLRRADPGRRQHGLDARGRRSRSCRSSSAWASSSSSSRSRPVAWTSCAGSRSAPQLPIVADESAVTIEDLDALVGVVGRRQREAGEVRRHRPGPADARACPRARVPDVPRLHGGDADRDRGLRGRLAAGGVGRPRRLPAPRGRPLHGLELGAGPSLDPGRPARSRALAAGRLADEAPLAARGSVKRPSAVRVHRFGRSANLSTMVAGCG